MGGGPKMQGNPEGYQMQSAACKLIFFRVRSFIYYIRGI